MKRLQHLVQQPLVRRVLAATGSNAYAQATTIGIQLLSLPLFLARWDLATYGQWLILSAVPSYLAMADVGMVTAAGNRMTMLVGEANRRAANEVFQSALAFVLGVCGVAMLLVLAAVALWAFDAAGSGASTGGRIAVLALSASVIVGLIGGLPEAVYKATHRYALGAALANTTRLFEWLGGLAGLWLFGDFAGVALCALVPRVLCTVAMIVHAARSTPAYRWGFTEASLAEVRHCAGPAISFMGLPGRERPQLPGHDADRRGRARAGRHGRLQQLPHDGARHGAGHRDLQPRAVARVLAPVRAARSGRARRALPALAVARPGARRGRERRRVPGRAERAAALVARADRVLGAADGRGDGLRGRGRRLACVARAVVVDQRACWASRGRSCSPPWPACRWPGRWRARSA